MKKRGWGIGCMWYGIGNTGHANPAGAFIDVLNDATVILLTGCADIGQGSNTTMAQIAAEEMGVPLEKVSVTSADTGVTPEGGATSASRQTYISGNAVREAAKIAKKPLREKAAAELGVSAEDLVFKNENIFPRQEPERSLPLAKVIKECRLKGKMTLGHGWFNPETTGLDEDTGEGKPYATYAFASQWAEVQVDTETGQVTVLQLVAAHDVGKAINPQSVEGQIEGGCAMGLGYALTEKLIVDKGFILNPGYANYLIPTIEDVCPITALIVEKEEKTGPFGAKGVGEPPLIPTAPAIINAIYNAVGVRINELPVTPEKILAALGNR